MGELLMLFITGRGSTAMGAILKGVFGYVFEARQQKHDIEMAKLVQTIIFLDSKLSLLKQVLLSLFLASSLSCYYRGVYALCVYRLHPISTRNPHSHQRRREGYNEFLFGLFKWQAAQKPIVISSGHISLMGCTVILPCILGFYFGPSGEGLTVQDILILIKDIYIDDYDN